MKLFFLNIAQVLQEQQARARGIDISAYDVSNLV